MKKYIMTIDKNDNDELWIPKNKLSSLYDLKASIEDNERKVPLPEGITIEGINAEIRQVQLDEEKKLVEIQSKYGFDKELMKKLEFVNNGKVYLSRE